MDTGPGSFRDIRGESTGVFTPDEEQRGAVPADLKRADLKRSWSRPWLWGIAIALFFAAWGLRTVGAYNVIETDAARHAMNGVFLRDLILQGEFTNVMAYARNYYAHRPAISLPYHPPMFPLIEAVFYSLFGVNIFAARLAVALTVAVSAMMLFGLVLKTHRSIGIAALSTITFLCLPESFSLAADAMLEFPALAFSLLAMYCLHPVDRAYPMRRALCFAVLGGAAAWTKQLTVFLFAVPFLYLMFLGRWRLFRKPAIWVSSAVFGAIIAVLTSLSVPVQGAGMNQVIPHAPIPKYMAYYRLCVRNAGFYAAHYYEATGPVGVILLAALVIALVWALFRRTGGRVQEREESRPARTFWRESALYLAWTVASLGVLFLIRPTAMRYMFFTYPALIVLGYGALFRIAGRLPGGRRTALAVGSMLTMLAIWQFPYRTKFLHGPEEVARMLAPMGALRILYCGGTDGNFILNYRMAHAGLDSTIIAADKLPKDTFTPANFERFAHEYGVQYVVIEDASGWQRPWKQLIDAHLPTLALERKFDLVSSTNRWKGSLRVYRFTNPSPQPKSNLAMRMLVLRGTMDFELGR